MTTDPFESPDKTSPFCVNAKHVTYLGRSRVVSNIPLRLYRVPPASSVQKLMWPLPHVTIWLRSSGWNSAATTVSMEHCKSNKHGYGYEYYCIIVLRDFNTDRCLLRRTKSRKRMMMIIRVRMLTTFAFCSL